jgi:uncharacterized protein YjiS (DUF1127 family)
MIKALLRVLCFASKWIHRSIDNIVYHHKCDKVVEQLIRHSDKDLKDMGLYRHEIYTKAHKHCKLCNGSVDVGVLRATAGGL